MVIGLDEILGKEYCTRAKALVEKRVATITLLRERLHCKNKKIYVFPQV